MVGKKNMKSLLFVLFHMLLCTTIFLSACTKKDVSPQLDIESEISQVIADPGDQSLRNNLLRHGDAIIEHLIARLKTTSNAGEVATIGSLLAKVDSEKAGTALSELILSKEKQIAENAFHAADFLMPNEVISNAVLAQIPNKPGYRQNVSLIVLRNSTHESAVKTKLTDFLQSNNEWTRTIAACALAKTQNEAAFRVLLVESNSIKWEIRRNCASALGWYEKRPEAKTVLTKLANDPHFGVSQRARQALEGNYSKSNEPMYTFPYADK